MAKSKVKFETIGKRLDSGVSAVKGFLQDSVVPTARDVNTRVVEFSRKKIIPNVKDAVAKGFAATRRLTGARSREMADKLLAAEHEIESLKIELGQLQKEAATESQELQSNEERLRDVIAKAEQDKEKLVRDIRTQIKESWKVHYSPHMDFDPQPSQWVANQPYPDRLAVEKVLRALHDAPNSKSVPDYKGQMHDTGEHHARFKLSSGNVDARIYWISSNGIIMVTKIDKSNKVHH